MVDELVDIVDENTGKRTGKTIMKSYAHKEGIPHLGMHLWIYNSKKEILLQHRAPCKTTFPNYWDISVAGHVGASENVVEVALREAKEELGLGIDPKNLEDIGCMKVDVVDEHINNKEFVKLFAYKLDSQVDFKFQEEEVDDAKFVSLDVVLEKVKSGKNEFVANGKFFLPALDIIKKKFN
jgi:isopentenyl-diphosphate Delta-isomerase